jgi:pimeloyl-ACP methyl ester carboxylesterase
VATFPVPVVCGHGGQSRPHHQEATQGLARELPRAELVVIEDASHGAHLTHPREFAGLVRRAVALL